MDININDKKSFQTTLSPGIKVRLIADPGRIGVITGKIKERASRRLWEIIFPEGSHFVPEDQFEIIKGKPDPLQCLAEGKFGNPSDLRQNLTFIRLSGRLANLIYSMNTTNTDYYPYQFKPVIQFLNAPGKGILIADEVGLGKTIEAGLIWTELRSRFDTRRLMVICPAVLREKWKDELFLRFGINAEILNAKDVLTKLKQSLLEKEYADFAIIGSFQGLRPKRNYDDDNGYSSQLAEFLDEHANEESLIDLLIIDEAHYLRNPQTMTAKLARLLKDVSEYIVLLSATPIHLRNEDLFYLLNLIDEDTFDSIYVFDSILEANKPLIKAKDALLRKSVSAEELLKLLKEAGNHPLLKGNRQLKSILKNLPDNGKLKDENYRSQLSYRLESINLLNNVVNRTRKREVKKWRVIREAIPESIQLTKTEKAFYEAITNLIRDFCNRYDQHEGFLLVMPQRQVSSSMPAALRSWQKRREIQWHEQIYEDAGYLENIGQPGPLVKELLDKSFEIGNLEELRENDSKFKKLVTILQKILEKNPNEKVVLFSYFRPTLEYLNERLTEEGIKSIVLKGGSSLDKSEIIKKFNSPDGPNILLSSEVGSEGIDLQFARMLINYDLPWNPMKIEQRIGRIDRLGQKSEKILIWNLFAKDTIDERIYKRLFERLNIFKTTLGGFEAVIGEQIRKLTVDLLTWRLTPEQEIERIEQTAYAIENNRQTEERLETEASHLIAHGDYILKQIKASRELNRLITGNDLWIYVRDFFKKHYTNCSFKQVESDKLIFDILLSEEAKYDLNKFILENKLHVLTNLTRIGTQPVRCLFENKVSAVMPQKIEIISQFHPLIRFISSKLKTLDELFYPTVSIKLNHNELPQVEKGIYVFTVTKWSVQGIHELEKLYFKAMEYPDGSKILTEEDSERLILTGAINGEPWPEAPNVIDLMASKNIAEKCLDESYMAYEEYINQVEAENNDRADILEKTLDRHLDNQLRKLNDILAKHKSLGRDTLVKATEGRIRALKERVMRKKKQIQEARKIKHNYSDECVGVLKLY